MQLRYVDSEAMSHATPLLAVGVIEGTAEAGGSLGPLDEALGGAIGRVLASGDMKGRSKDEVVLYGAETGPDRVLLLGLGAAADVDGESVRRFAARAVRAAERLGITSLSVSLDGLGQADDDEAAQAAAEGAVLAAWKCRVMKSADDDEGEDVTGVDLLGGGDERAGNQGRVGRPAQIGERDGLLGVFRVVVRVAGRQQSAAGGQVDRGPDAVR